MSRTQPFLVRIFILLLNVALLLVSCQVVLVARQSLEVAPTLLADALPTAHAVHPLWRRRSTKVEGSAEQRAPIALRKADLSRRPRRIDTLHRSAR